MIDFAHCSLYKLGTFYAYSEDVVAKFALRHPIEIAFWTTIELYIVINSLLIFSVHNC